MNKKLILASIIIFFTNMVFSQAPAIQWQKSLGGSGKDVALNIERTSDGGYITAGYSDSNDGDVTENRGFLDFWIVKSDSNGNVQWQKTLGGSGSETAHSIKQTLDSGYIVLGRSASNDGDVSGNHGSEDFWIVKLNANGNIQWQKSLGGISVDSAFDLDLTSDGGYILKGESSSNSGDVTGNHGSVDFWVLKLDSIGNIQWQKSLGGSLFESAYSIQQTSDSGYILAGGSRSNDGDVTGNHGSFDFWIVKLNNNGSIEWQKSLGGSGIDIASNIKETSDGGYIVAGYSNSNDGDVTGNRGGFDYWIVKLDNNGIIQWQKSLGGSNDDYAANIQQTLDGKYIVVGSSLSNDGDVSGHHGDSENNDAWIVRLNSSGDILWEKSLGGSKDDLIFTISQTLDGGYILAGNSGSNDGDVTENNGDSDLWIVKLAPDNLNINETAFKNLVFVENPVKDILKMQSQEKIKSLQLYTADGKLIETSNSQNMSVKELPKGMYILRIQLENGPVVSEKIIKE
ncbi:MAG: T9SS type A sorting domain-containing protein [Chryseobacterium sp.]|nr:T9SS type A sorting domain-containing protein [Chryseobacterium sp.]